MTDEIEDKNGVRGSWIGDVRLSLMFLSRLPVSVPEGYDRPLAMAMRAFPVAGAILGALGGVICVIALWLSLSPAVAGLIAIVALLFMTGGLHEDGLADVADGFGGGGDRARKLEIMKDSRIGSYGVLALVSALLLKAAALAALLSNDLGPVIIIGLFAALGGVSRAYCVSLMATTENARGGGLASSAGQPLPSAHRTVMLMALVFSGGVLLFGFGFAATLAALIVSAAAFVVVQRLALRQIGGHTGDVAGTVQVVTETAMLICLSAFV